MVVKPRFASASLNALAEANRSAGSFASPHSTAIATLGGTVGRSARTDCGSVVISFAMIACAVAPVCGGSPVSISYVTAPSE